MYNDYPRPQRSLLLPIIIGVLLAVLGLQLLGKDPLGSLPSISIPKLIGDPKITIATPVRASVPKSNTQIQATPIPELTALPSNAVEPVIEQAPVELYATAEQSLETNPYVTNPNREVPLDNNCNGPNPPLVCVNATNGQRPLVSP